MNEHMIAAIRRQFPATETASSSLDKLLTERRPVGQESLIEKLARLEQERLRIQGAEGLPRLRILGKEPFLRLMAGLSGTPRANGCLARIELTGLAPISAAHGDEAAAELTDFLGRWMRAYLRESDVLGRIGPQSYAAFLPQARKGGTETKLAQLAWRLGRTPCTQGLGDLGLDLVSQVVPVGPHAQLTL